jgi:hypothetical protein
MFNTEVVETYDIGWFKVLRPGSLGLIVPLSDHHYSSEKSVLIEEFLMF